MRTEERLLREIRELEASRDQAKAAVENVRELLRKADARRLEEDRLPWGRIYDNLEKTLDLTRARFTTYEQLLKERQRDLAQLRNSGAASTSEQAAPVSTIEEQVLFDTLRDVLPEDVPLPKNHVIAAERILAMSLDVLGNMTLDQAASLNAQLFEAAEAEAAKGGQDASGTTTKQSWLADKIAHAKQTREALAARRSETVTFADRRRNMVLRNAIEKVITANYNLLDLSEIELVLNYGKTITEKTEKSPNDLRLKGLIDACTGKLNDRASDLRRRRAQTYIR